VAELEQAHPITCPHCWQTITVWIDLSAGAQRYVEDCAVCCRPIAVSFEVDGDELVALEADAAD
jgi:hypothetical protein